RVRRDAIELALDPRADAARRLERQLRRELVVVAVIALEAVVAREIALQRGQHRDPELRRIMANGGEILVERAPLRLAVRDDEPVFGEDAERVLRLRVERAGCSRIGAAIEQRR